LGDFLEKRKFSSPREEALELGYVTRNNILNNQGDAVSILRACLVIATILNKKDTVKWVRKELSQYTASDDIPEYRFNSCIYTKNGKKQEDFYTFKNWYPVHLLMDYVKRSETIEAIFDGNIVVHVTPLWCSIVLSKIIDYCLTFLNEVINELQYGGIVEYLMEEIRKNTDEKLATLDKKLADETQSLFMNLISTNPADWNKVGHSCRKMLKILADNVFPPKDEKYKMKDKREIEVGDPHFINRLCAFLDQKLSGGERKFLISEIKYFESYLRQVTEYAQMGEHKPSIEKYHADMLAIHTYLIISEILKHKD